MEIIKPPCEAREAIIFDFSNLVRLIEFFEGSNNKAQREMFEMRCRISVIDQIESSMRDIQSKMDSTIDRLNEVDKSLYHHSQMIMNLELKTKTHIDQILSLENEIPQTNDRITCLEDNSQKINIGVENLNSQMDIMKSIFTDQSKAIDKAKSLVDRHEYDINNINKDITDLKRSETGSKLINEKTINKMKKLKTGLKKSTSQIDNRLNFIENLLGSGIANSGDVLSKNKIDFKSIKESILNNEQNEKLRKGEAELFKKELNEIINKLKATQENHVEEINNLKKLLTNINFSNKSSKKSDESKKNSIEEFDYIGNESKLKECLTKIENLEFENKALTKSICLKSDTDDLNNFEKSLRYEIERISKRFTNLYENKNQHPLNNNNIEEEHMENNNANSQDIMGNYSDNDFRRIHPDVIKDNEFFTVLYKKTNSNTDEINKLYKSLLDIRRLLTEELSPYKAIDFKELPFRLIEMENDIKISKNLIEGLKSEILGEGIINDPLSNEKTNVNLKDYVKLLSTGLKISTERIETLHYKMDCLNTELLQKVKKDLSNESARVLDEFRANLKKSLFKIEELLNDKVDRFNFDEFSKKLDLKIFQEISKKLDKRELNKNTHQINKKIDQLENKISRTLVDTLIDIQVDEAPLIVKKGMQIQGERCASCSHFIPVGNVNNVGNVHFNETQRNNFNSSINNFNHKKTQKDLKFQSADSLEENLISSKLGKKSSVGHFSQLPEISNTSIQMNNKGYKNQRQSVEKENYNPGATYSNNLGKNTTNINQINNNISIMDEESEKQLNDMINTELEKKVINPENIMRATKRIYYSIDKKNKEK